MTAMDTFTCGTCNSTFNSLDTFLNHKQNGCTTTATTSTTPIAPISNESTMAISNDLDNDGTQKVAVIEPVNEMSRVDETTQDSAEVPTIYVCKHCNTYSGSIQEMTSHYSEVHGVSSEIPASIRPIMPLPGQNSSILQRPPTPRKRGRPRKNSVAKLMQTASVVGIGNENIPIMTMVYSKSDSNLQDSTMVDMTSDSNAPGVMADDKKPRRRPGRPRKSEQALQPLSLEEQKKKEVKEMQSFWDEENLTCRNCKMKFSRLRQLHSHRCMIDVLEKEGIHQSDEESPKVSQDDDDDDDVKPADSSTDTKASEKKSSGILKIDVTEEEQIQIEQAIREHEIPQIVNDNAPSHPNKFSKNTLKVYTCPYCEKFFKFKQGMIHHIRSHTNYKPFKCSWCDYASASKGNLKTHERKHTGERFKCPQCTFTCISKGHLKMHSKTHKKVRILCELCRKNVYTLPNLLRHLETSHNINSPGKAKDYYEKKRLQSRAGRRSLLFQCSICDRKFKTKREHDTHLLLHQAKKPFTCTLCEYKTVRKVYLDQHIRKHKQVYICSVCQDKHLSIQLLKRHLTSHVTTEHDGTQEEQEHLFGESIKCSIYLAEVLDRELESARLNRVSSGDLEASAVEFLQDDVSQDKTSGTENQLRNGAEYGGKEVTQDELKELLAIDQCGLKYKTLNISTLQAIQKLYGEQECQSCGKLFMFKTHLENHVRIHLEEKEFKCLHENCDYSAHSQENLKIHVECAHSGVKYQCIKCGFETKSNLYLQTHMRKHVVPDAFKCTRCDAKFGKEKDMKNHIADNHPGMLQEEIEQIIGRKTHIYRKQGKEWFQCEHCPLKFRKIAELRQHLWQHQGLMPYKCEICGHGTRNRSNLKAHMLRHSDAKTHLCDECGKSFKTKNSLKVHSLSQHTEVGQDKTACKITVKCNYCDFTCVQRSQLKKHLEIHTGGRPYKCGICVQHFSNTKCGLRSHYSKEHPDVEFDESLLEEQEAEGSSEQLTVMQYKCTQCLILCNSYDQLVQHFLKEHNLEIATSSEEVAAAATLIQAAAMAENSITDVQEVQDSGLQIKIPVPGDSAAELLQQIISVQGLDQISSGTNQVQIQLPLTNNLTSDATSMEDAVYSITQSITPSQPNTSNGAIQTYAVTHTTQPIIEGQAHATQPIIQGQAQAVEDSSSIMQVHLRVEGDGSAEQFFITEGGEGVQQQVVLVKDGENMEQTYMEMAPDTQQTEVVQVATSSEDNANRSQQDSQPVNIDATAASQPVNIDATAAVNSALAAAVNSALAHNSAAVAANENDQPEVNIDNIQTE